MLGQRYRIYVKIKGFEPTQIEEIRNALNPEWDWEGWFIHKSDDFNPTPVMIINGESRLTPSETEEECASRLIETIWKANQQYCDVWVYMTCLEDLPHKTYHKGKKEYQRKRKEKFE